MIDIVVRFVGLLSKPLTHLFKYWHETPAIKLDLNGTASLKGAGRAPEYLHLKWYRKLVLHNDSPHVVRGIKLLRSFPREFRLKSEIPTRLEPDQKLSIDCEVEIDAKYEDLVHQYGATSRENIAQAIWPRLIMGIILEFELANAYGRKVYQLVSFEPSGAGRSLTRRTPSPSGGK